MTIAGGTIVSSLMSDRLNRRLGTGKITFFSVATTAIALYGFSLSRNFIHLFLWAVPYGLGAGGVDAALNNYVALHYESRHMSWLHCMWGVGASLGPLVMGNILRQGRNWSEGYQIIAFIQTGLTLLLLLGLPLWGKTPSVSRKNSESLPFSRESVGENCPNFSSSSMPLSSSTNKALSLRQVFSIPGAREILFCFCCYSALEQTTCLWTTSYLTLSRGLSPDTASLFTSLFFLGVTLGRGISGFMTLRWTDVQMIRIGQAMIGSGLLLILLPLDTLVALIGFMIVGLGCAPIYPCIIHSTPDHFGQEQARSLIGVQMACAYVGACIMPPLFGLMTRWLSVGSLPFFLGVDLLLMTLLHEKMIRKTKEPPHPLP